MKSLEIQHWLAAHNITLTFKGRDSNLPKYYTATNPRIEVVGDGVLKSAYGNANTKIAALRDYAEQISGQTLLIGGYDGQRIKTPKLIVKNLKGLSS